MILRVYEFIKHVQQQDHMCRTTCCPTLPRGTLEHFMTGLFLWQVCFRTMSTVVSHKQKQEQHRLHLINHAQQCDLTSLFAYRFSPPERFAKFQLASGVCYNNPLESSASALEVAAVAGRNCALLLHEQLMIGRSRKINSGFKPQISRSSIV